MFPRTTRSEARTDMQNWSKLFLALTIAVSSWCLAQLTPADLTRAAEVERLLQDHANSVWASWGPQPLLLRSTQHEYLVAHPEPPAPFRRAARLEIGPFPVFVMDGHLTPGPIATAWQVGEVWSVAIPTRDVFQETIDRILGPNVVELDDPTYIRAVIHEAFHAFQLNTYEGPNGLPRADETVNEREILERLTASATIDEWHTKQGRALARALMADGPSDTRMAARTFLELRAAWRVVAPEGTRALEQQIEWIEGLARYADTTLMIERDQAENKQATEFDLYPSADEIWSEFLDQVRDPTTIAGGLRDRYYVLGAAQAFVLDRVSPGWRPRALPGGQTLEDLLIEAVGFE